MSKYVVEKQTEGYKRPTGLIVAGCLNVSDETCHYSERDPFMLSQTHDASCWFENYNMKGKTNMMPDAIAYIDL